MPAGQARGAGGVSPPGPDEALARMLAPRSVALVGVKGGAFDPAARDNMSRRFLENLLRHGYDGAIHPVNPRHDSIGGLVCHPSVAAIPGPVDAAVLIVPKALVGAALADCGAKGVAGVTVITSGYAETGAAGRAEEAALVAQARAHGMRLFGPNCFGYYNSHAGVNLFGSASLLTRPLLRGAIGLVTQSGALAASMVDRAQERGIGFSHVITTGNQGDLGNVECLEFLVEDGHTRVIALFAEGIADGERFRAVARRAAALGKPFLVLKTGASEIGRQAALAHTGSLVGDDAVVDAVFRQDGVIRCTDADELFECGALLALHGSAAAPGAARTALISMSGAMGGLLADGAARTGVALADLAPATQAAISAVPGVTGTLNPLDAAGSTWSGGFEAVGKLAGMLADDAGVDVVLLAMSGLTYAERLVDDAAAAVRARGKVFVPLWAGDHQEMAQAVPRLAGAGVIVYDNAPAALRAIRALDLYRRHRQARERNAADDAAMTFDPQRAARARALLAESRAPTLSEHASKRLLALYGVALADEVVATSADAAVAAAARLGYPVALKIHCAEIPHKTEAGGIRLGLTDAAQVREAYAAILTSAAAYRPGARLEGVLVAPMARPGIEVVVGAYRDPQFGPVLLAGLGGVLVEVMRDTVLRVTPLGRSEAQAMLDELRGRALFDGVRGRGPADRAAVAEVLVALSTLMCELGDAVAEIDVNPLIVHGAGQGATLADALVVRRRAAEQAGATVQPGDAK